MEERRKPVLGRVVPGVTPDPAAAAAHVFRLSAVAQRAAGGPARLSAVSHAAAPQGRARRRAHRRAGQKAPRCVAAPTNSSCGTGATARPVGGAAARLGKSRGALRQFHRATARRRLLGDRHRRARAWRVTRAAVGPAAISRLPRRGTAHARARTCRGRSFARRWRRAHGARGNRRTSPEEDLPVRRAVRHGLHPRVVRDDAGPRRTRRAPDLRARFTAHFGRPAADYFSGGRRAERAHPGAGGARRGRQCRADRAGRGARVRDSARDVVAHAGPGPQRRIARRRHHRTRGGFLASEPQ